VFGKHQVDAYPVIDVLSQRFYTGPVCARAFALNDLAYYGPASFIHQRLAQLSPREQNSTQIVELFVFHEKKQTFRPLCPFLPRQKSLGDESAVTQ
jgi:hypothetical protein